MAKIYALICTIFLMITAGQAQVSNYSFTQSNGTYTPISGADIIGPGWNDGTGGVTLPFGFTFNGVTYFSLSVNSNGYLTFGATLSNSTSYGPISSSGGYSGAISALGNNLVSNGFAIQGAVSGTAPNRTYIIQWNNVQRFIGSAIAGDVFNFQIRLQEGGGVAANQTIQVVYGNCSATNTTVYTHQVGLRGATNSDFNNRVTPWTATVAGTVNTALCSTTNTAMPSNGLTFTWSPPVPCIPPTAQPTAMVLTPFHAGQVNGSFTAATGSPSGYLVVRYPTGATPTAPVSGTFYTNGSTLGTGTVVQAAASTSFVAIGLTQLTTYDFYIYAYKTNCIGTPAYLVANPLTGNATTPAQAVPTCTNAFFPNNAASNIPITQTLTWSSVNASPTVTGYNIYLSVNSALVAADDPAVRVATVTGTSYAPANLNYSTTYYWKVVPINTLGPAVACAVNSFSTYVPNIITSKPGGGLWSSSATWQGGVVPLPGDDVVITDGSIVTVDVPVTGIRNLTIGQGISGVVQWNNTTNAMTLFGNLTINTGARFLPYTITLTGQTVNIGGNFVNNGFCNLAVRNTFIKMNGAQQNGGSANQNFSGVGSFVGNTTDAIIDGLSFYSSGNSSITTSSNLVTGNFAHSLGNLNTNGKLKIDNTAQVAGQPLNTQVANLVVTGMGAGYTTAPVVFGASVNAWTASGAANAGSRYFAGTRVYLCTTAGTFNATTAPSHTSGIAANGTANLLWLGNLGSLGNPFFSFSNATVGTQYFYGNNLYTCTATGLPSASAPPVHVSGVVSSGTAVFRYAGTVATATVNYDALTQTVRSLNLLNAGSGYTSVPAIIFSGAATQTAVATAIHILPTTGPAESAVEKSGAANLEGGLNINSNQSAISQSGVGNIVAVNGGVNYTVVPTVGFSGPTGINLVTASGGGYTTLPSIVVSGGTLLEGTALTNSDFTISFAQGKAVSVYLNFGTTAIYSVPPTLSFTGGGGSGATLAFPAGCWPTANASIGSNGQLSNFVVTSAGYGYVDAPRVGIGNISGTAQGGTFTLPASSLFCTIALYNLTINTLPPANASTPNNDDAVIPVNRKINNLTLGTGGTITGNLNLSNNLELFASDGYSLNRGILNLGGNTLFCSSPYFRGTNGSSTAYITNGAITYTRAGGPDGTLAIIYPFDAIFSLTPSSLLGNVTEGSTVTTLTVNTTAAPAGGAIGTRAYRVVSNSGAIFGSTPIVTMNWNGRDSLVSNNAGLRISQATALGGPWTVRSQGSGSGALSATGTRSTPAIASPGPIVPTGNDYFAWTTTFVAPPPLAYTVTRTTGNAYQSIAPIAQGGDGTGTLSTAGSDENEQIGIGISSVGFVYQGSPVTAMSISPNGFISLHNGFATYTSDASWNNTLASINNGFVNTAIASGKRNIIAPFYEDLNKASPVIYYKIAGNKVTVEWYNTTPFGLTGPQLYFQVVLDATDQSITFNYGNMQLYNGTQNVRYSYTSGISGGFVNAIPKAGQIMQQQYENTVFFNHENGLTANWGANGLSISPAPRSSIKFTPGAYQQVPPPASLPPANDDPVGAILRPALPAFPSNIAWDTINNSSNLFTTRFATNTATPVTCGGAANAKDVWFKFIAPNPSVTVRIYGSGGFIPRVSLYDSMLAPLNNCTAGLQGLTATTTALGLTVNKTYFIRVHHETTGIQATATATVSNGAVTGLTVTPGTNYSIPATAFFGFEPQNQGPRISFSGGGGNGAVAAFTTPVSTTAVQTITAANISLSGGAGYTSAPTVTIESPDWGITGEFGIILFSLPENDECNGAFALTNLDNTNCVVGQNTMIGNTKGATASPEAAGCGIPDDDLWYKFTATEALTLIKVQGNGLLNTAFQVFNGGPGTGSCDTKIPMVCVNASLPDALDSVTIATTIGNTYFLRVYHADVGAVINENFSICVTSARPACVTAPISPANGSAICPGTVIFSWQSIATASMYKAYLNVGSGTAVTLVYSGTDTSFEVSNLTPGTYTWRLVPENSLGNASGCINFSFTINTLPNVFITPTGSISICAPAAQSISLNATSASSPSYQWLNGNAPVVGATGPSFSANRTGQYRLLVTDGITGCSDTSGTMTVTVIPAPDIVITPAAPTVSCDPAILSVLNGKGAIKITEVTLFKSGTGSTINYPSYINISDGDYLEISNISPLPVDVGGYRLDDYLSSSNSSIHPYTLPAGTVIPSNGVLVLHLGTGTDDPANRYFNTGGIGNNFLSSSQVGFVIKDSTGNVADAVGFGGSATGSYVFAAATGVTAADWTGFVPNISGFAGWIRTSSLDNNVPADWVISNSPSPQQTIGTYNGGYNLAPLPATWSPTTGLFTNDILTIPYTGGSVAQLYARPGATITYTLQANNNGCPGSNTVTVTVVPATTISWTSGAGTDDWHNPANWSCGAVPTVNTHVFIPDGMNLYPVVRQNVEIKSLTVQSSASVTVSTGIELKLNGTN